ncbi:MAG: nitroreductase [Bacteroidetes bacterium]|nr:MAG: nitroreductase [Bacteroidota bacterium]
MNKETKTNYDIHPLLKKRWSPRAFSEKPVEKEKLQSIFEAVRWSPSASNEQPWAFIIGKKGDETYDGIMSTLVEFNQIWSQFAPVLILSCARKDLIKGDGENFSRMYDVGQAVAYLSFQAASEGLYVHQMTGFDAGKTNKLFHVPDNFEAVSVIAVGYIGDPKILHPNLEKMEYADRIRKPLKEFIFSSKFGVSPELF